MVEKVTKKPEGIITANHPVGAPLDVRSLPRRVTTVTIPLNADQITQPSRQTNILITALRQLRIHEKAQSEVLHRARQILNAESESINQCNHPALRSMLRKMAWKLTRSSQLAKMVVSIRFARSLLRCSITSRRIRA